MVTNQTRKESAVSMVYDRTAASAASPAHMASQSTVARCTDFVSCPHGNLKKNCRVCTACPHGKVRQRCRKCIYSLPAWQAEAQLQRVHGCPHGKVKRDCVKCSGCPHGRIKRKCKECRRNLHSDTVSTKMVSLYVPFSELHCLSG